MYATVHKQVESDLYSWDHFCHSPALVQYTHSPSSSDIESYERKILAYSICNLLLSTYIYERALLPDFITEEKDFLKRCASDKGSVSLSVVFQDPAHQQLTAPLGEPEHHGHPVWQGRETGGPGWGSPS